jgi:hypothetical protein
MVVFRTREKYDSEPALRFQLIARQAGTRLPASTTRMVLRMQIL